MSCAHSFGEWCSECIDGMVQNYNRTRVTLREAQQEITRLQAENARVKAERDELEARIANALA
jgi:cell division protein FtsB